ncbi:hypothetical protein AKJ16_DCAP00278 [Drosera capensis]
MSRRFSFLGFGDSSSTETLGGGDQIKRISPKSNANLRLETDKEIYRPGDVVWITVELEVPNSDRSLLVESLSFELKGVEKLDPQWFATQKPVPGKGRRGEYVFLDCSASSMVSNQIVAPGVLKKYLVRIVLPDVIPPSYKGTTIRYLYYVRSALFGRWLILDDGDSPQETVRDLCRQEARNPLQIWVSQKGSGLQAEENQGIVPPQTIQTEIYWKEIKGDSDWVRANEIYEGVDEDYDSTRDEISSVSSYNPASESFHKFSISSLSMQSSTSRFLNREGLHVEADELLYNSSGDILSMNKPSPTISSSYQRSSSNSLSKIDDDDLGASPAMRNQDPNASEAFIRGRSYNIRLDDQVLLRFSPKKSDSIYYFCDMIGGTLTFFHEEGARRCLEVSITLEISETISRSFVHPSRRNSPTITKVQSDCHEVVADLVQTSFMFSIPMDGPMSFSTPHVSVNWALRFEFFTTPKNVDWRRYDHPLLAEGREKCEWSLPLTVHATQPGVQPVNAQSSRSLSFSSLSIRD